MMSTRVSLGMAGARLLLLACTAALVAHARAQPACTYASAGFMGGVPFHLAVTYLAPGLADWKIAVPVPPPDCATGYVSGEETVVCDFDVQPYVQILDRGRILVRRNGWLQGYATVNVTVFCVFTYTPIPLPNMLSTISNRFQYSTDEAMPPPTPTQAITPWSLPTSTTTPTSSPTSTTTPTSLPTSRTTPTSTTTPTSSPTSSPTPTLSPAGIRQRSNESILSIELTKSAEESSSSSSQEE